MTQVYASIVLVDDHELLRDGLRALIELESDLKVVGDARRGAEGVRVVQDTSPSLVITDLTTPGGPGRCTIEELRAVCPKLRVLVLSAYCTDGHIEAALGAGADGYVLKEACLTELLQAIRSVIGGQKFFSEAVSARLVSGYLGRSGPSPKACPRITAREREVLTRVALGESNKRVAMGLRLSVKTVEKHRANLMRKFQLHNTAAITLFALRNGLLPTQDDPRFAGPDRPEPTNGTATAGSDRPARARTHTLKPHRQRLPLRKSLPAPRAKLSSPATLRASDGRNHAGEPS